MTWPFIYIRAVRELYGEPDRVYASKASSRLKGQCFQNRTFSGGDRQNRAFAVYP
jgi:hypothetical protein